VTSPKMTGLYRPLEPREISQWCREENYCQSASPSNPPFIGDHIVYTILIIILVLLLLGALPTWPYSSGWGYYPSGGLGLVLLIIIILALMGRA
jgi:uncharacterized protein DUF3309